jgi:hypothetical protein
MTCLDSLDVLFLAEKKKLISEINSSPSLKLTPKDLNLEKYLVGSVSSVFYYPEWLSTGSL